MWPLLLAGGALLYFLRAMAVAEAAEKAEEALEIKRAQDIIDARAYTDGKIAIFNSLSPEERRNYKGGF